MPCTLEWEDRLAERGLHPVAGIDEAGRGCLAGPVVAGAVILPPGWSLAGLDDSKKLTPRQRDFLFDQIERSEVTWAVGIATAAEIDCINILRATHLAMARALEALCVHRVPGHALVDGLRVGGLSVEHTAIVGGDGISLSIAAASVMAKVTRDRMMCAYDREYPGYDFSRHKGYGTREHLAALRRTGPCAIHRRSFAPVSQAEFLFE